MEQILVSHIEKSITLSEDEITYVLSHFRTEKFKKKESIIQAGSRVNDCYFIIKGLLKLVYTDKTESHTWFHLPWKSGGKVIFQHIFRKLPLKCRCNV